MSWLSYPPEYVNAVAQSCLLSENDQEFEGGKGMFFVIWYQEPLLCLCSTILPEVHDADLKKLNKNTIESEFLLKQ